MPTHQGKMHTDILIGDGGENAQEHSSFEFDATYPSTASLEYVNLASGTDRNYGDCELIVRDEAGATIGTFAARYRAWIDRGSASGPKSADISNNFTPSACGDSPSWPLDPETMGLREWRVDTFDGNGNVFARLHSTLQLRSTVANGVTVVQNVIDQTDELLRVQLLYMTGRVVHLHVIATLNTNAQVKGRLLKDPPDVADRFIP